MMTPPALVLYRLQIKRDSVFHYFSLASGTAEFLACRCLPMRGDADAIDCAGFPF